MPDPWRQVRAKTICSYGAGLDSIVQEFEKQATAETRQKTNPTGRSGQDMCARNSSRSGTSDFAILVLSRDLRV